MGNVVTLIAINASISSSVQRQLGQTVLLPVYRFIALKVLTLWEKWRFFYTQLDSLAFQQKQNGICVLFKEKNVVLFLLPAMQDCSE